MLKIKNMWQGLEFMMRKAASKINKIGDFMVGINNMMKELKL